jgi:hypothetical protein
MTPHQFMIDDSNPRETAQALLDTFPARVGVPKRRADVEGDEEAEGLAMIRDVEMGFRHPIASEPMFDAQGFIILEVVVWRLKLPGKAMKLEIANRIKEWCKDTGRPRPGKETRQDIKEAVKFYFEAITIPTPSSATVLIGEDRIIFDGSSVDAVTFSKRVTCHPVSLSDHGFGGWLREAAKVQLLVDEAIVGPIVDVTCDIDDSVSEIADTVEEDGEAAQHVTTGRTRVRVKGQEAREYEERFRLRDPDVKGFSIEVREDDKGPAWTFSIKGDSWGAIKPPKTPRSQVAEVAESNGFGEDAGKVWLDARNTIYACALMGKIGDLFAQRNAKADALLEKLFAET